MAERPGDSDSKQLEKEEFSRSRRDDDGSDAFDKDPPGRERSSKRSRTTSPSADIREDESGGNIMQKSREGKAAAAADCQSPSVELPAELESVDFTKRVCWRKFQPYTDTPPPLVATEEPPAFAADSPALCHQINAISHRARACTIHLKRQKGQLTSTPVKTPMFMPVGTKGCLKGLPIEELTSDPALGCPIILGNTYHLAIQPGTSLVDEMGGLHSFQGMDKVASGSGRQEKRRCYNLLVRTSRRCV